MINQNFTFERRVRLTSNFFHINTWWWYRSLEKFERTYFRLKIYTCDETMADLRVVRGNGTHGIKVINIQLAQPNTSSLQTFLYWMPLISNNPTDFLSMNMIDSFFCLDYTGKQSEWKAPSDFCFLINKINTN